MAWLTFEGVALLTLVYVAFGIVSSFVRERRFAAFAKAHACHPPLQVNSSFVGGFSRLFRLLNLEKNGEDLLDDLIAEDMQDAATIEQTSFDGTKSLQTSDPANLQAILATQFQDFVAGQRRYDTFSIVIGRSIFSSDGIFWSHSRALFRPQFARENINDLEMTDRACNDLITAIGATDSSGWTANAAVLRLLYNFTLDTATDFLFGETIESQKEAIYAQTKEQPSEQMAAKIKEAREFAQSFAICNQILLTRIQLQSLYFLGDGFEFRRCRQFVRSATERYVKLACDTASSSAKPEGKKQSLLFNLATQTGDRTELRDQTLSILLAGRDTTASLVGWAIIRLALHPKVFSKLRNIVLRDVEPGEEITFAKLKGCRYLQHFLNEVLRLHPTIPLNQRVAARDTTLPTGGGPDQKSPIAVRKGQIVLFSVYNMQRREQLWGSDAAEFRPERWEQRVPPWQFLPFLGGPRICLGQQFALTESGYLIVRLLQEYDAIEPEDPVEMRKLKKGLGVTMWPGDGVKVRFHKASK